MSWRLKVDRSGVTLELPVDWALQALFWAFAVVTFLGLTS